eukprot:jgi/Botrbrau1/22044/Bobra.0024s0056.1
MHPRLWGRKTSEVGGVVTVKGEEPRKLQLHCSISAQYSENVARLLAETKPEKGCKPTIFRLD